MTSRKPSLTNRLRRLAGFRLAAVNRSPLPVWLFVGFLIAGACTLYGGFRLALTYWIVDDLEDGEQFSVSADAPANTRFARAWQLEQTGDRNAAAQLYIGLKSTGDERFRARVRYNLGSIYLRDAAALWNNAGVLEFARVGTLLQLAKDNLRESLRLDPGNWDARFNLEFAERITPPPKVVEKADFQGTKASVFSTLPGIPGGGP